MPFMYAHACCAELALLSRSECLGVSLIELLKGEREAPQKRDGPAFEIVKNRHTAYRWGCQGPDIWFFHGVLRPFGSKRRIGSLLHAKHVDSTLAAMLDACLCATGAERDRRFAYFAGFLTHYALDSTAHPFVHSRCGKPCHHSEFEAECDVEMLAIAGKSPATTPPAAVMPTLTEADKRTIASVYELVLKSCGADAGARDIREVLRVAPKWQRRMEDKTGDKRRRIQRLEKALHMPNIASRFIFPVEASDGRDALNLRHGEWRVPWSGEIRRDDLLGLIERAATKAAEYIELAHSGVYCGERERALLALGDFSLDNGLPWRDSFVEERYFDGIYGD